jgi:hypothetical protein
VPYYSVLMVKLPTQQENSIYSLPRGISQSWATKCCYSRHLPQKGVM